MFEYEFGGNQFTKKDVEDRAAEKGLSVEAYLANNPQVTKIDLGKQKGTTTQDEAMVSNTESTSENGLLEQVALESPGDLTSWIDKSFFDKTEEEAVSQLTIALEGTEFKVTESGKFFPFDEATKNDPRGGQRMGLANFVEIEAPNGEKLLIETAISSSSALALKKKGKEGLEKYYADLESDLKNFIEINSDFSVEAKRKRKENRANNRKLYIGFQDAVKLTDDQAEEIELEFPDISIFDTYTTKKVVGVGRSGAGMDLKFSSGQEKVVTETIQPYEKELTLAKSELGEDATKTEIKERALQILRENSTEEIVKTNSTSIIDQLQDGEIPPSLEEEFDNYTLPDLNYDNLKSYITIGSKQYSEDYVAVMNGVVNSKVKLEEKELAIQDILDKKVYTKQDIADYEIARQDYNQQVSDYNATLELYSQFATIDVKDINTQLSLLQKNYDFWEKQSTNVALNFRDFASRASYGVSSFIGADGHLPDADNPDMTREEVRTLKLNKILDQSNIIKSSYEDDVAFENAFGSFENFMKWSVNMANTQLPILASLAVPGGWSALLANSFGENYSQMTLEEMEAKAAAEEFGQSYEEKGKFNKWGTSLLYAAPEVIIDRLTTGVRVRGVMDMFKASSDELVEVTSKKILNDIAYGIPTDATMGALSEGTTQIWQNWITGKDDLTEGFAEAALSGLLMDGSLSAMPTLKAAAVMQFTDQNKLKEVRELQTQIDQLYTLQSSAFGSDLKQDIKDLEAQRDEKIREINDSVIGIGALGLTNSAVEQYTELTSEKAKLKNRAKEILDNNLLTYEQKQKQLAPLKAQYDAIKQVQDQYRKEKGTEFNMFVANSKNKAEVDKLYADAKAKFAKEGKTDPTEIQIKDQARIDYNLKKIEKDIISKGKKGKLDEKLLVIRSEKDIDNIKNKEGEAISAAVLNTIKEAYASGDGGVNIQGESIEGDKTSLIFVENMAKDDRLEVRTHELYHELTKQALLNDKTLFDGMAYTIENWAKANDTELYNRLQRQVQRKNGKLVADEVIANFMEEVAANRVKLKDEKNRGLLSIFTFGASKAMKDKYGIKFEIAGVTDSFELMYGLAKKISKGTITEADIAGLSESEAIVTLKEQGKQIQEQYLYETQEGVKKASKVQTKIDDLGNKYTREEWQASGADQTIAEIYDDLAALIGSKAFMLERLPNFSKEDFITDAIGELIPHIRNFNIDRKKTDQGFGLSGWINSQLMNKIGNVLKKKTATSETFTVDEDAETFREQVETADDLATFEEEDLSLQAQLRQRQRAEELAERGEQEGVEYSEFRRQLEFNGQKGISDSMKKAIEKITLDILSSSKYINLDINALEKTLQRDFEVAIKTSIQNAMGGQNDYVEFLAKNKDIILKYMDISSLVAIERQVSTEDKILTEFVRRLTTQQDVQDAVDNGWLSHVDNPAVGPNLYKVLNPSTSEFLKFYNPPLRVDSPKKVKQWDAMPDAQKQTLADNMGISLEQARTRFVEVRSGLKGTRKDTLAERIAGQLAFDATMQVIQSPQFASIREAAGMPVVAQSRIREIARKIDRGIEVKFAGKDINHQMGQLAQEAINEAASRGSNEIRKKSFLQKNYPLLDQDMFNAALDIADFILIEKNYTSFSEKEADHRDYIIDLTIKHNVKVFSGAVRGKARSAKYMSEYSYIKDHEPIAKDEGIMTVKVPLETGQSADMTFYIRNLKEINYGAERKMANSQGPATALRPIKEDDGSYTFEKEKKAVTKKKRVKITRGKNKDKYRTDTVTVEKASSIVFDRSYVREGNKADADTIEKMLEAASNMLVRLNKDFQDNKAEPYAGWNETLTPKQLALLNTRTGALGLAPYNISRDADGNKFMLTGNWTAQRYDEKKRKNGTIEIGVVGTQLLNSTDPNVIADNEIIRQAFRGNGIEIPTFTESIPARIRPIISNGKLTLSIVQDINGDKMTQSPVNARRKSDRKIFVKGVAKALNARGVAKVGKSSDRAIEAARLTNHKTESVGMSAFDFDETLIVDGENFVTATKGSDIVKISSGKWPIDGPRLAQEGYKFDFSDFVNVRGGVNGPLMKDFKKKLAKYGAENMFILTARPQEADKAIHGWLKSKGINIPLGNITGLGNSTGEAKAQWMLEKYGEGYNDMYFVDDALPNVEAVEDALRQTDAKSNVKQAKIKYSRKKNTPIFKARMTKARPDLNAKQIDDIVGSVFDFTESDAVPIKKRNKFENLAYHYIENGFVILPEDGYKVIEAERLAAIKKIDPFSVGNPNEIIEKYAGTVKGTRTNPDTVKEFSNKKDLGNGVVTYDVDQTKEGQLAVRKVIDTHLGKKSDPWCLTARMGGYHASDQAYSKQERDQLIADEEAVGRYVEVTEYMEDGELVYELTIYNSKDSIDSLDNSYDMWKSYQKGGKGYQIVFTNGKLSHFRDGSGRYWDRLDEPSDYISKKLNDIKTEDGFTQERELNVNTGKEILLERTKITGNKQNGVYTKTVVDPRDNTTTTTEAEYKDGERLSVKQTTKKSDGVTTIVVGGVLDIETIYPEGFDNTGVKYTEVGKIMNKASKQAGLDLYIKNPTSIRTFEKPGTSTDVKVIKGAVGGKEITLEVEITTVETEGAPLSSRFQDRTDSIKVNGKTVYTAPKVNVKLSKKPLLNSKSVQNVFNQLDIKSDAQQAKIKFASKMSATINEMIERSRGIPSEEVISRAISKRRGKNKNRFQVFIPPSADDFLGLMYYIIGEGKQGEADFDFIKKSLVDPFSRAYTELDAARQTILNDLDKLNKNYREVYKKLGDTMPNSEFTFDNAIRVYLFNKHGHTIPGVSNEEVANLVGRVNTDMELLVYAETLDMLSKTEEYLEPGEAWTAGSIVGDINRIVEGVHRKTFLGEWIENKNEIFSEENLNKLEAAYGTSYRSALEDILYRMETGISRPTGANRITNQWTNWLNNSVGAIMFFNSKSALLQTISTVNYLNFEDNNVFKAAKAFANQKQYWADFTFIFNSDFLKQRRSGLKTDVSQSEIASAVAGASNKAKAALAYLLKIGFLPTQAADSFAISAGGATFYRNRINKYLAEGKTQKEAQEQAFIDFREISEESQQSARPDRVSQQQTTNAGRLILAFQNAPMQFNRIIKKAALDLINKRGDWRSNTSRIIYYGGIQSLIFLTLQNALFALAFDDEDENKGLTVKELQKKEKFQQTKYDRIVNGMVDTLLRGSGITGAVISTLKNTVLKFMSEAEKGKRMNEASILTEALQISPQIGSKARKIISGVRAYKWDGEAIPLMSKFNTKNPLWLATAPVVEGLTNVPLNRLITKVNNLREAANAENAPWQRAGVALGWSAWDLGVDAGAEVDELIKKDKKEKQAKKKRCKRITSKGTQCKNTFTGSGKFCYAHD